MIKLNVSAANIAVEEKETLTEGRVGLLCRFSFTGEWDGLAKTAVFDGADSRDVILTEDTVAVPAECLAAEGYSLSVGVYGKNAAGDIVIPTVYATVGKIQRSAYPAGKEAAPPTPDVVAQIQQAAANAEAMARSVREDADLGKFNGEPGEHGGWYTPEIRQPIKKSMVVYFNPSKEGMPAVEPKLMVLPEGEPGGWYTPAVTQPDENTLRVAFTPSREDMPAVEPADITIPTGGGGGTSGEDGGYYAPSVDDAGNLTWTASKTNMPAVDGANIKGPKGDTGATGATGPQGPAGATGADGKSAYAYAVEGGYTGTEAEFAAKLAAEKFANPNALTFTGAVTGSYDGSAALSVEIPIGGETGNEKDIDFTIEIQENTRSITFEVDDKNEPLNLTECFILIYYIAGGTNTSSVNGSIYFNGLGPITLNSLGLQSGLSYGRPWMLHVKNMSNTIFIDAACMNTTGDITSIGVKGANFAYTYGLLFTESEKINSIFITFPANAAFGPGSKIRIIGR